LVGPYLVEKGLLKSADSAFAKAAVSLMQQGLELVSDSEQAIERFVRYPLADLMASGDANTVKEDNLTEMAAHVVAEFESGALQAVRLGSLCACLVHGLFCA
jgi:glutamyl-tRNA synthetase